MPIWTEVQTDTSVSERLYGLVTFLKAWANRSKKYYIDRRRFRRRCELYNDVYDAFIFFVHAFIFDPSKF